MPEPWTLKWLFTEAGAGWTFGIVSLIISGIGLLLMVRARTRPQHLVCKEVSRMSLVNVSDSAISRIEVQFDDIRVNSLTQLELDIINRGSEPIKDISLNLFLPEGTTVLDAFYTSTPEGLEVTDVVQANRVEVSIPFLNQVRHHGHKVTAHIVCDGSIEPFEIVEGANCLGWSVKTSRLPTRRQLRIGALAFATLTSIELTILLFYLMWKAGHPDVGQRELLTAALLFWLVVGTVLVFVFWLYRWAGARLSSKLTGAIYT
jgi:hypothetical protein